MNQAKKKILFHLSVPLKPLYYGTQRRLLGILKYFKDRKDYISVDAVAANQFRDTVVTPRWDTESTQEALNFIDNVSVYEGKYNLYDLLYTRSKSLYYQKLLRQQMPVDSDYYAPPGYVKFVNYLVTRNEYDFIWINTLNFAHLAAEIKSTSTHTIIDTHDLCCRLRVMTQDFPVFKGLKFDYELNFLKEVNLLNKFHTIISDSNYELSVLAPYLPSHKLQSIPHPVDGLRDDSQQVSYQNRKFKYDLLFLGNHNPPNEDGIKFFLDSIFPRVLQARPNTQLAVAGKVCEVIQVDSHLTQNVKLLGYVPDLSELHLRSRLVISPLLTGAGTKVKLIEAMSYSLPIVTTPTCASALFLQDGINALVTDDPVQYANHVLSLLTDFQFAQKLSQEVKTTFEEHYSMPAIYSKLDAMLGI
ncbi:glycosyltransferase [Microcoleus sp. MON1_C1]|uniref:glycosyltransferase n=1 Tax=Microcoleus sp. MON1_C1 TaxID=2818827 RepID=UPI002FD19D01